MAEEPPVKPVPQNSKARCERIKSLFFKRYGHEPTFYARAPGRVNLIGEHIDYCGYSVLPMAIEQDVIIAVHPNNSGEINLSNTNPECYKDFSCNVTDFNINKSDPQWHNYFLCGLRGMLEHLKLTEGVGLDCMVEGTVPASSGLSSSSAMVCCASLATMYANGQSRPKSEIADMCAHCEHYIGTEGGGMDQAISFMAREGTAKLIEFNPLRATDVVLPEGAVFVISNSCVESNKAAASHFNIRVVECRLATQILAKTKGLKWRDYKRLADIQKALNLTLDKALALVKEVLHEKPYTREEVRQILELSDEELMKTSLSANTLDVQTFKLRDRASHVFSEANRVLQFKDICDKNSNSPNAKECLGKLMSESHASCRDLYECSHPDLDKLVDICLEAGALGSRLTGAGWGGCAVSMVPANQVADFIERVKKNYYDVNPARSGRVASSLFASQPGAGAAIYLDSEVTD